MYKNWIPYFSFPDDGNNGGGRTTSMSTDEIVDFLNTDDDPDDKNDDKDDDIEVKDDEDEPINLEVKDDEDEDDDKSSKKSKSDEEDEDEDEDDEDPDEEDLELATPVRRKEILAKYPKLFKEFPQLEKAWYREQQFTELLGNLDDAKVAKEAAETLNNLEKDLMAGDTVKILTAVKNEDPKAFAKIADDYMGTLQKVDPAAYQHVLGNIFKTAIIEMVNESKSSSNEVLQQAAQILHQFVFGKSEWKPITRLSDSIKTDPKEDEFSERERSFEKTRLDTFTNELSSKVTNSFKATIENNIDPRDSMTSYVKRNAVRDAQEVLEKLISRDSRFTQVVNTLWRKAKEDNYSEASLKKIRGAYISKGKTLLPAVIKKARVEALRGSSGKTKVDESRVRGTKDDEPRSKSKSGNAKGPKEIPKGMSTLDFLMAD